jgi:hypothetical protein
LHICRSELELRSARKVPKQQRRRNARFANGSAHERLTHFRKSDDRDPAPQPRLATFNSRTGKQDQAMAESDCCRLQVDSEHLCATFVRGASQQTSRVILLLMVSGPQPEILQGMAKVLPLSPASWTDFSLSSSSSTGLAMLRSSPVRSLSFPVVACRNRLTPLRLRR